MNLLDLAHAGHHTFHSPHHLGEIVALELFHHGAHLVELRQHPVDLLHLHTGARGNAAFAANGAFSDNLQFADREKDRGFIDSIVSGKFHNQAADGVQTALSCMLGRMAGVLGREVTWEEQWKHGEEYKMTIDMRQFS